MFCFLQSFVWSLSFDSELALFPFIHRSCCGLPDCLQCSNHVGSVPPGQSDRHHLHHRSRHGDDDGLPDVVMYHADGSVLVRRRSQCCQSLPHAHVRWDEDEGDQSSTWWRNDRTTQYIQPILNTSPLMSRVYLSFRSSSLLSLFRKL